MNKKSLYSLVLGLVGVVVWFMAPGMTRAATEDDAYISNVSIDSVSTTTLEETATYTVSFTNSTALPTSSYVYFNIQSVSGCNASDYTTCSPVLNDATVSGLSGEKVSSGSSNTLNFVLSSELEAGTHTVTFSSVTNPSSAAAVRVMLGADGSDEEDLLGDEYSDQNWYVTASDVELFGTPLVSGTILDPNGAGLENSSVNFHNTNWSAYGYAGTDSKGFYAIFQDYFTAGYWAAGTYTVSVYPPSDSGYLTTESEVAFDGLTPVFANLSVESAAYFFAGEVIYGDNKTTTTSSDPGDPVTNADLYFSPTDGGVGYSGTTDENGEYSIAVRPGTYYLSMSLDSSDENQEQDWNYQSSETFSITSEGTQTEDITVTRTTARLKGTVTGPDGQTVAGSVQLSNSAYNYSTWAGSDGTYTLNLNPGTFTVTFSPDSSDEDTARYFLPTTTLTVAEGKATYDLALSEKTSSVVATVTDQDGNPLVDVQIGAWRQDEWVGDQTDENGQATVWIQSSVAYQVSPWADGYIYNEPATEVKVAADKSKEISFVMFAPDASISVLVTDTDGEVPENAYGWVSCNTEDYSKWYGGNITNGVGTVYLLVDDSGVFEGNCGLWMNDENLGAAAAQEVSIGEGEVGSIEFQLVERNAEVIIYVKNASGTLVKDATSGQVNVWNEESKMWQGKQLDASGQTKIKVVPGTYTGGVWFEDNSYIPLWQKNNGSTTVQAGESGNLVLTVLKASATVSGTVLDPNGDPVKHGWAFCGNWEEVSVKGDFEGGTVIDSGTQIQDGSFSMALVAGHDYRCNVGAPSEFIDQGWLPPEDQVLEINAEGTDIPTLSFQFSEADSKIKGSVTFPAETSAAAKGSQHAWCWAWGENGGHSYTEAKSDGTFSISVQSGGIWHYGCDSQDGETWLTTGEQSVDVSEPGTYEASLQLQEFSAWKVYNPVTQTFDATQNTVINLEDGTVLTIPANAITSSGDVTVTATPESNIVYTGDSMLGIPWNFEAFQDGELIETFLSDVTIEIPYTTEALTEFGVDEDSLVSKYYDDTTGAWQTTDNVTQNKKTNTITVTTNHFTQYGVTYNAQLTKGLKPGKPEKLSTYDRTDSSAVLSWKKSNKKTVTKYTVQVRPSNDQNKKHWRTFDSVKGRAKTVKKLDDGTSYQFRVKSCNSGFCSSYSNWAKFKTK
ncbi:MAG: fibronectin type III domain-containing protein [Patescibacteria group bacterium]